MLPVGFCLADLTALHRVVIVGDREVLVAEDPLFMIEQPAHTAILAGGIQVDRLLRGQKHEISEFVLVRVKTPT